MNKHRFFVLSTLVLVCGLAHADTIVTFDAGEEGWVGPGGIGGSTSIDPIGGNPGSNLRTVFSDFGITFRNSTNAEFVGDYTQSSTVTLAMDIKVESIEFFGSPVPRPWLIELRDFDNPPAGYPYVSVWYKFADISEATHGSWTHLAVTIDNTLATELPPGWGGTGAEDPETFEPTLPADRTFTDVIDGVDEIAYTTFEPGFFFGETAHDVRIDNLSIASEGGVFPGEVPSLLLGKSESTPGDLVLSWSASCGTAQDHALFQGLIADWDSHVRIDCSAGVDLAEEITPGMGDRYYLVVPIDDTAEGSYGRDSSGVERPQALARCRSAHNTTECDPG